MKLTKKEKQALSQEIKDDIPEFFSVFSPGTWLCLSTILLLLMAGGFTLVPLANTIDAGPKGLFFIMIATTLAVCIPNIFINEGLWKLGRLALKILGLALLLMATILFDTTSGYSIALSITSICAATLALYILHSRGFLEFCKHRKLMADWKNQRIKKNKDFMRKTQEKRSHVNSR